MAFIELQDAYQEVLSVNPPRDEIQKKLRFTDVEPLQNGPTEEAGVGTKKADNEEASEEKTEQRERETLDPAAAPLADTTSETTVRPEDNTSGYSVAVIS